LKQTTVNYDQCCIVIRVLRTAEASISTAYAMESWSL